MKRSLSSAAQRQAPDTDSLRTGVSCEASGQSSRVEKNGSGTVRKTKR